MKCILWVAVLGACFNAYARPMTFYVDPKGNDAWSGMREKPNDAKTAGPLATLQGALNAIHNPVGWLRTSSVTVSIADGEYPLAAPVEFSANDYNVTFAAAPGAHPVFSAGRAITGWKKSDGALWVADIPEARDGKWRFEQLWVNGQRATRARTPNTGWFYMQRHLKKGIDPATGKEADLASRTIGGRPEDFAPLSKLTPQETTDVTAVVYHSWESSLHRAQSFDASQNMLYLTGGAPWAFFAWGAYQRYHLENFREALDSPGEWFLAHDGKLYYWPRPGEDMAAARVVAPVAERMLIIRGRADEPVSNLTFRGLAFSYSGFALPKAGYGDAQAVVRLPAAVEVDHARNVAFEDCEISHTGLHGIWFHENVRDSKVSHCLLEDLGAGGVKIGHGWEKDMPGDTEITRNITIDNNIIVHGGRIHYGAVGVWIGHSSDNAITHNEIADFFYTGISAGWRWGYKPSVAKRNKIEFNHIHHLGWGVLSDMAGVYTLGPSEGTTVSNNYVHHVSSFDLYGAGSTGLYTDEGSTGIVMENNLVHDTRTATMLQHYGRENVFRNNIYAYGSTAQLWRARVEPHISFTFERNIVFYQGGDLLRGNWADDKYISRSNLFWRTDGPVTWTGKTLAEWQQAGHEPGSVVADPQFADPVRRDFHLRDNSPVKQIGFVPFDYTKAGVYGDDAWRKRAADIRLPEFKVVPDVPLLPPLAMNETYESSGIGDQPFPGTYNVEGKGDAIGVTEQTAASGKRCLKFTDAPGLKYRFNPHLHIDPRMTSGPATVSFDFRYEAGVEFSHEWRDNSQPYHTGPSLWVRDGKLHLAGKSVAVPVSQWFHLEIHATLGNAPNRVWSVTVTLPDGHKETFDNIPCQANWNRLEWVGFVSNADAKTVFYIDNLKIENR